MTIQNTTFRVYVEKLGAVEATDFIGNEGDLFYDPNTTTLRLSDGSTAGGITATAFGGPGIGTGSVIGTFGQINVIGVGSIYQLSLPDAIILPGTLSSSGVTTMASDGSDSFTGGDLTVAGKVRATRYSTVSDERLKTNVQKIDNPLELLSSIEGVTFNWIKDDSRDVGLIAQDVERALPRAVQEIDDIKTVNYNGVIGLLVEAVKELSVENQMLRMEFASIKAKL